MVSTVWSVYCLLFKSGGHVPPVPQGVGATDWAAWHFPGGPVVPASRWAAMSIVAVGQTTYPV